MPGTYPTRGSANWDTSLQPYIDRAAEFANVAAPAYGADPTGVADATTAIHAARDAGLGTVYFPPGTYKTAGLTANVAGQRWVIAPGATIQATGATHAISVSANGVTIEGPGKIDTGAASAFSGVFFNAGLSDGKVLGVEVVNGTYGVRCKGGTGAVTTRLTVSRCHIHNTISHGVFFNWETTDSEISFNQIHDTTTSTGNGVWCGNGSSNIKVTGNTIKNVKNGIEFASGGAPDSLVEYNTIDTANIGISMDSSHRTGVSSNRVTGASLYGLECAATTFGVWEDNVVINSTGHGMSISALSGSCDHNIIKGNHFYNCHDDAIYAGGSANGAKHTQVIGNHIYDPGVGAGAVNAIGAVTGIGGESWQVEGNYIYMATGTLVSCNLINLNTPNNQILGNYIYVLSTVTTAGGNAINLSTAAINCTVQDNYISGNGKLNNGVVIAAAATGSNLDANTINGTILNVINNLNTATSPLTNVITNNVYAVSAGNAITGLTSAQHSGNRSSLSATDRFDIGGVSGTTAPGAGGAGALPATPLGYLTVQINGTNRQIAYY